MFSTYDRLFMGAAFASFLFSIYLWFFVNHDHGVFVAVWVPTIVSLWGSIKLCRLQKDLNQK